MALLELADQGQVPRAMLVLVALLLLVRIFSSKSPSAPSDLPLLNRSSWFEPRIFARFRWGLNSRQILDDAYRKYPGQVYRVDRGDVELVVVPVEYIPELNALPEEIISSRRAHAYNLVGHVSGINIVHQSGIYFKTIMNKLTPALPSLTPALQQSLGGELDARLKDVDVNGWTTIKPLPVLAACIGRAFSLISAGDPISQDPEYIDLISEQTRLVFGIVFLMRFVPNALQTAVGWLHPFKWLLVRSIRRLEKFVVPEIERLQTQEDLSNERNLLSWVIQTAQSDVEKDPKILTKLHAVTASGGTHSVSLLISNALFDLIAHPELLEQVRQEIEEQGTESGGEWQHGSYGNLLKLDSAMKESGRVGPITMPVYNRLLMSDYTLSNGITLKKGQMICAAGCSVQQDPALFEDPGNYDGLRTYKQGVKEGTQRLFRHADSHYFWGAGRWACPGRFLADLEAKILLVKLLDEYEFKLPSGDRPKRLQLHDYGFIDENATLLMRRREKSAGVGY